MSAVVALRSVFLRTLSSSALGPGTLIPVSSLCSPLTHTACRLQLLGGVWAEGALLMEALVCLKGWAVLVFITKPVRVIKAVETYLYTLCAVESGALMVCTP